MLVFIEAYYLICKNILIIKCSNSYQSIVITKNIFCLELQYSKLYFLPNVTNSTWIHRKYINREFPKNVHITFWLFTMFIKQFETKMCIPMISSGRDWYRVYSNTKTSYFKRTFFQSSSWWIFHIYLVLNFERSAIFKIHHS